MISGRVETALFSRNERFGTGRGAFLEEIALEAIPEVCAEGRHGCGRPRQGGDEHRSALLASSKGRGTGRESGRQAWKVLGDRLELCITIPRGP